MQKQGATPLTKAMHPKEPGQTILICHACNSGLKQPLAYLNYLPDSWQPRKHEQYQLRDVAAGNIFHIPPSRTDLQGHPFTTNWMLIYLHFFLLFSPNASWEPLSPLKCDFRPGTVVLPYRQWGVLSPYVMHDKELAIFFLSFSPLFFPQSWTSFPDMFTALKTSWPLLLFILTEEE